ncbi:Putative pentatricopeptide repeat-containing protein [Zea mays]|uniref:Putative pentatricopeptide repeat-containing protein n=1 Tax=Zea mays TaxID=4577 RepID=A0A1D6GVQ6_MAIZE|nr:Putative pentatricopeptide repeat-containing protein [Zea mays]
MSNVVLGGLCNLKLTGGPPLLLVLDMRRRHGLDLNGLSYCYAMKVCYQDEECMTGTRKERSFMEWLGWVPSNVLQQSHRLPSLLFRHCSHRITSRGRWMSALRSSNRMTMTRMPVNAGGSANVRFPESEKKGWCFEWPPVQRPHRASGDFGERRFVGVGYGSTARFQIWQDARALWSGLAG